jgi:cAMP phosphodiesterase
LLAVDAGVHLAAISRILEGHKSIRTENSTSAKSITLIDGPFEGLQIAENSSCSANAAYITRDLVECFLITHPHLDHISGFVINTASLPSARPKRLAGLPSTIEAFKNHIFNNIIWPNLTDENNGAGLVTYLRLVEGGSPALGDGYVEVSDGLSIKTWGVSHGHCIERHNHRGSNNTTASFVTTPGIETTPRMNSTSQSMARSGSTSSRTADTDQYSQQYCVYDSSAYFIRDVNTDKEILIFGDVEPDSISYSPRNRQVWNDAAPKVVKGMLGAVFIECSYDDSRQKELLFGHLTPKYLVEELRVLANDVKLLLGIAKKGPKVKKRKHEGDNKGGFLLPIARRRSARNESPSSPPARREAHDYMSSSEEVPSIDERRESSGSQDAGTSPTYSVSAELPLQGVKVVIFHIKEKFEEPDLGDTILKELIAHEKGQLGCEFIISHTGQSLYF